MALYFEVLDGFQKVMMLKIESKNFARYTYTGKYLEVHLNSTFASTLKNYSETFDRVYFVINRYSNPVFLYVNKGYLDPQKWINKMSDLRVKLNKFNVNPFPHVPKESGLMLTPVNKVELYDELANKIEISIESMPSLPNFQLEMAFTNQFGFDNSQLQC